MSVKDFSNTWDQAAQRALEATQESELSAEQLLIAAGMRVRSGILAGSTGWEICGDDSYGACNPTMVPVICQ